MAIFYCTIDGETKSYELKETMYPDVIVNFERKDNYNGEFGFDWYRADYPSIILDQSKLEALKNEYTPTTIKGKEYFIPWLAMFPNQNNVKLMLNVAMEGKIVGRAKDATIQLPAQQGIRFEPSEIKITKAKEEGKIEVQVFCEQPLTDNLQIDIKYSHNDEVIGKINILKNDNIYNLGLRLIKVVSDKEETKARELTYINDSLASVDLENFLNKNSLQQALIKTKIDPDEFLIELDYEKLKQEKKIDGYKFANKDTRDEITNLILKKYIEKYDPQEAGKDIIVFITALYDDNAGGLGQLYNAQARYCFVLFSALGREETFAHEIGHVLGCEHTFESEADEKIKDANDFINKYEDAIEKNKNTISEYNERIKQSNEKIEDYKSKIAKYKQYQNNPTAVNNIKILNNNIAIQKETIVKNQKNIANVEEVIHVQEMKVNDLKNKKIPEYQNIKERNFYKFKEGATTNFMDYLPTGRKDFFKWQWDVMQKDINDFYSEKK